jgi:xylulose-5-phosphate/fructose-6-phosphate phosphoketolase
VAFQQVPRSSDRRRGAADPASQRLQIANPTLLARITREELEQLLHGYGWMPYFVEGHEPGLMHGAMAATLDTAVEQIKKIQQDARVRGNIARPRWPMIVLKSPKGWTGPKMVDGLQGEGTFRSHQVPLSDPATHPEHLKLLEDWLRSYHPEELFDEQGRLNPELADLAPKGERRMTQPGGRPQRRRPLQKIATDCHFCVTGVGDGGPWR